MNIIIAGAGEVGFHLAKMLSDENHQITIVDKNEARLNQIAETSDVVPVAGIVTSISTLEKAGISRCDLFIAVSPAEEQDMNIVAALLAKQLGAKRVTARINNNEYLKQENRVLFTEMGIDLLFYPENIAAHRFAAAAAPCRRPPRWQAAPLLPLIPVPSGRSRWRRAACRPCPDSGTAPACRRK